MKYILDTKESYLNWKGTDEEVSHLGTLKFKAGVAEVKHELITGGAIVIDVNTLNATGPEIDDDEQHQLSEHLKSREFLDVQNFSEIVFKIQKSEFQEDLSGHATGILQIKGNAFGLSIPLNIMFGESAIKIIGQFNLSRVSGEIHNFLVEHYDQATPDIDISFYIILNHL